MPTKTTHSTLSIFHSFKSSFSSHPSPTSSSPSSSHFSSPKCPSTPQKSQRSPLRLHPTLSETMMEENIAAAKAAIAKHAQDPTPFYGNRHEARDFLKSINNLQQSMLFFVSSPHSNSDHNLVCAQTLMQTAMKRLEREFYHILSINRDNLDTESISNHSSSSATSNASDFDFSDVGSEEDSRGDSIIQDAAMLDLRSIAECMISAGYGKECVKIYETVRKSIVEEGLYTLGFEQNMSPHHTHKLDWEAAETKIRKWLNCSKIAVKKLFLGERALCDHVFAASGSIKQSCFAVIVKDAALDLFMFPESVIAGKCKKHADQKAIFPILDLCDAISELMPDIECIFSYESTSSVRSQAATALAKLSETVRTMIHDFEIAMQKDTSRSPIAGGGLHPLTCSVTNYISSLAEYRRILSEIYSDQPFHAQPHLPEILLLDTALTPENPSSSLALRFAWLILVLLCKLDGKAELYKDVGLPYLFLANNLHHVLTKIRISNLHFVLGHDWISSHDAKVHLYVLSYEKVTWGTVFSTLPEDPTVEMDQNAAMEVFRRFKRTFGAVYHAQTEWVVPDERMRENIKVSVKKKIVTAYRDFYRKYRVSVGDENDAEMMMPDLLDCYLSELFFTSLSDPIHAEAAFR